MQKAFTMIELIFVIIILGVIAAVAVPKLNATRDNAHIVSAEANLRNLINDINSYYTSYGDIPEPFNLQTLTNVPLYNNSKGEPAANVNAAWLKVGDIYECFYVEANRGRENNEPSFIGFKINENVPANSTCAKFIKYLGEIGMFKDSYLKRYGDRYSMKASGLSGEVSYQKIGGSKVLW